MEPPRVCQQTPFKLNSKLSKSEISTTLTNSWYRLRLSVRHPARVPTWDAIVLTAASPEQAQLYEWQLQLAKRIGRIAASTVTLAVPDPHGQRIGSGAATLNAIHALARHYHQIGTDVHKNEAGENKNESTESYVLPESNEDGNSRIAIVQFLARKHILLLHAGGDSKRVPWANPMGKVFLPLPYLGADDPDGPVPLLFDHILAISSCARQAFKREGGLFIMTGDVLPCFDASTMVLPEDGSCIITVPVTLDVASNHGVIVASKNGVVNSTSFVSLVDDLLQKPNAEELVKSQAILDDGRTLLDTGLIAVRGNAWVDLVHLSCSSQSIIMELLKSKKEMSLYEDLVAAWVPAKHEWLRNRPAGLELINHLGKQRMWSYCSYDLHFLHFGTSSEVLDHLSGNHTGLVGRRHLCSIPATTVSDISASSVILSSKIAAGVSVGDDSLIYNSSISGGVQIGSLSIVVGVNIPDYLDGILRDPFRFILPDRHCIWEVPLVGRSDRIIVYCGLHDNPKSTFLKHGTFCGKPWKKVLEDLGIKENDLWSSTGVSEKCLWNAKIYPIMPYFEMLKVASWLMGLNCDKDQAMLLSWRNSSRFSLEELHRSIDFPRMCLGCTNHQADLANSVARACINHGLLGRNLSQLCDQILQKETSGIKACEEFLAMCPSLHEEKNIIPQSRAYQVQVDLLRVFKDEALVSEFEEKVWAAVAEETASAVRYGFKEHLLDVSNGISASENQQKGIGDGSDNFIPRRVKVELPVRVDIVGGWSDTPPWSLERAGCVLNMAISLEGSLPIGTIVETSKTSGIKIVDDSSNELHIEDPTSIATPFDDNDPFRLVKSALLVTGVARDKILLSTGLNIRTWAHVPRGSGLGTSSILAAAVVKALLQIIDGDESNENVARLVLVLEQLMGTGGGWQDQIGGLYSGIKLTNSFPGIPLRLQVNPLLASPGLVSELQQRMLVVFTGQVRLAHHVLKKVVTRYLRRDNLLVSSIKRLVELAKLGREALMNCDVDTMGDIMLEAWTLHQELDPYCSNELVDRLFEFADPYCCGYKLVGAGGGGFALLLAKDVESSKELRRLLGQTSEFNVKVYDWNIFFS